MENDKNLFEVTKIYNVINCKEKKEARKHFNGYKMIYASHGNTEVLTKDLKISLFENSVVIIKGEEAYTVIPEEKAEAIVFVFSCNSNLIYESLNKNLNVYGMQRFILENIIDEFKNYVDDKYYHFSGAEQMARNLFEQFLILLYRKNSDTIKRIGNFDYKSNMAVIEKVTDFLHENISNDIKFSDVLKYVNISATALKKIFKENMGMGVMKYFNIIKIEKAKMILSEGKYNVSQVALLLGYESIHYFSRQFKELTGISPSYYNEKIY